MRDGGGGRTSGQRRRLMLPVLIAVVGASARIAGADAGDRVLVPTSAGPGEGVMVPQAMPMAGLSGAAAMVLQLGRHVPAGEARPSWGVGFDGLFAASLWGIAQVEVGLPLRWDVDGAGGASGSDGGGIGAAATDFRVAPVRIGGRVPIPGFARAAGETGGALGLRFTAEIPVAAHDTRAIVYRPSITFDDRRRWTHLLLGVDVPIRPASDAAPLGADVDVAIAGRIWLCAACNLSVEIAGRLSIPATGPSPGGVGAAHGLLLAGVALELPSPQLEIELFAALPVASPLDRTGDSAIFGLGLRRWFETTSHSRSPSAMDVAGRNAATAQRLHAASDAASSPASASSASARDALGRKLAQAPGARIADTPLTLDVDLAQVVEDAGVAIDLANRRYLHPALARRGQEALFDTLAGTATGMALGAALMGATIY